VNRSPLIAFAGGTVVIAVMVLSAFATMPIAGAKTCPRGQAAVSAEPAEPAEPKAKDARSTDA